jgi:hypothetical protein
MPVSNQSIFDLPEFKKMSNRVSSSLVEQRNVPYSGHVTLVCFPHSGHQRGGANPHLYSHILQRYNARARSHIVDTIEATSQSHDKVNNPPTQITALSKARIFPDVKASLTEPDEPGMPAAPIVPFMVPDQSRVDTLKSW